MPVNNTQSAIIKNMMLSASYKSIAELIGVPVGDVEERIKDLTASTSIITYQQKIDTRKKDRPTRNPAPKVKKIDKGSGMHKHEASQVIATIKAQQKERLQQKKRREPLYKNIEVDYSKLVLVKIDRTTFIYAKPGEEEKVRREYLKKHRRPLERI